MTLHLKLKQFMKKYKKILSKNQDNYPEILKESYYIKNENKLPIKFKKVFFKLDIIQSDYFLHRDYFFKSITSII